MSIHLKSSRSRGLRAPTTIGMCRQPASVTAAKQPSPSPTPRDGTKYQELKIVIDLMARSNYGKVKNGLQNLVIERVAFEVLYLPIMGS